MHRNYNPGGIKLFFLSISSLGLMVDLLQYYIEEVYMSEKCHSTTNFLSVTLPYICNFYVSQVSQKENLSFCDT